ncbi:hypothetical protein [Comamonas terrigena]|uniref:Uncharacterized protein n=1 Tax=Comamonas terrigena TaxID=32013 RepID=A0A2A7V0W6_COMTR|nr:hypothetical protein [Comamonas terrigena]PEH91147.1 hypothetical protein CRM82_16960 [Comamonas terrigena]SUY71079.1 Uncharacterised protein [Comamonas terrigena]
MDDFGNELPALSAQQVNERFDKGSERMAAIERDLKAVTQQLHERNQQLVDLLEFITAMKGAIKVFHWFGMLARPAAAIVALGVALTAAWNAARGGIYPK